MNQTSDIQPTPLNIEELTREKLASSSYWKLEPDTFSLVISGLLGSREDALEVFRLIVALVQYECPGIDDWLPSFNQTYKTLQCWNDDELAAKVVGDRAAALDSVRRYVADMREKHPESKALYAPYNLIEGLELAWETRNQPLAL
jgi:hypothetical protein